MSQEEEHDGENEALRRRIAQLLQQARDTEQAMLALARGEVDAVSVASAATPVLLQAAQESLRHSQMLLRNIFDGALDAMLLSDDRGRYVDANPAACELFGLSREDLLGRGIAEFAAPEYDQEAAAGKFREQGRLRERFPLLRRDGGRRILDVSAVSGVAPGLNLYVLRDVTDRVAAEESLRASEARYRRLIEDLPEPVLVHAGGRIAFANAAAAQMAGLGTREELLGQKLEEFATPASRSRLRAWPGATESAIHNERVELDFVRQRDQRELHLEIKSIEVSFDGRPATLGIGRDITERVEAARAAAGALHAEQRSQRLQRIAGEVAKLGGWSLDLAAAKVTWSDEVCAIHEVAAGFIPDVNVAIHFYAPEHRAAVSRAVELCAVDGTPFDVELEIITARGQRRWVRAIGEPVRADSGHIVQVQGAFQDITERRKVEESLRASESRFRAMANSMSQLACIASSDGAVTWYNERWYEYTGTTPEQALGWGWQTIHDPSRLPAAMEQWKRALASGKPFEMEFPLRGADGRFRDFLTRVVPLSDATGKVVQWFATNTDVHELKRIEASLRTSQDKLKDAQRIARLGSWEWDVLTGTLAWSEQVFVLFGMQPSEFAGDYESFLRGVHPEDRARTHAAVQDALAGRAPYDIEHRVICRDGTVHVLHERGEVARDAAGRAVHMAGTALDITESKAAEALLAETNRALRLLSRCNEALIRSENEQELLETVCRVAVTDGEFCFAWVGYALDDERKTIAPQASAGVAAPGYLSGLSKTWSDAAPTGQGPAGQVIRRGEPIIVPDLASEPSFAPWRDAAVSSGFSGLVSLPLRQGASTFGVLVLYLPRVRTPREHELRVLRELADDLAFGIITLRAQAERRRLQVALQKVATSTSASTGARFFEQLASNMVEALGAQAGCVARLLPGLPRMARTVAVNVLGQPVAGFDYLLEGTPSEGLVEREEFMVQSGASEHFQISPSLPGSGARAYIGRRLDDASGQPMGILFVLFQDALKSTEFVSSTLQIFATRAAVELERQRADARLREQASLLDKAQDAIVVRDLQHRILYWNKSAERRYGWTAKEAIGQSAKELLYDDVADAEAAAAATLRRGEWVGELHQRHKNGTPVTVEGRWSLVRDDDGNPKSILAVNTDLTERKKLEKAEEQLRQAQKMEAIGSLAGGVAHDFNNVLSVILSYADLIITDLQAADPLRADLEEVRKAGLRAMELTRQLLAFSRKQILQPVVLELNQVVANVEKMLGRLLGEDIDLSFSMPPGVGRIHADAGQIEQVLMNLVVNARDAMPNGGNLSIETANTVLDESYAADHVGVKPGPYVLLAVTDTGVGMDRATQARIFEPFFTTKDKSKGTGLGLSTVYGIVQQSGGHIWVYSEPGKGSTFKVYLPRSDRDLSAIAVEVKGLSSLRGTETVLLVEDEEQVRAIMRTILSKSGYHVLEAQNGGEALLICEQFSASIHLLITDVVMPRMSGRQLAERVAPLRPDMKVLFVSGYTENTIVHHGVLDAGVEFLAKPIMPEPLLSKVRATLDQPAPVGVAVAR